MSGRQKLIDDYRPLRQSLFGGRTGYIDE